MFGTYRGRRDITEKEHPSLLICPCLITSGSSCEILRHHRYLLEREGSVKRTETQIDSNRPQAPIPIQLSKYSLRRCGFTARGPITLGELKGPWTRRRNREPPTTRRQL